MLWAVNVLPPELPTILIAHNLEYQLLAQQVANYRFLAPIFKWEITKQRRYEIEGFRRARGVIFVSAPEMTWGCTIVLGCEPFNCRRSFRNFRHVRLLSQGTSSVSDHTGLPLLIRTRPCGHRQR